MFELNEKIRLNQISRLFPKGNENLTLVEETNFNFAHYRLYSLSFSPICGYFLHIFPDKLNNYVFIIKFLVDCQITPVFGSA